MTASSDTQLTEQIRGLMDDAGLAVSVEVHDGVARLIGVVDSPELRQAAIDLAHMVDGVRGIDDQIEYEEIAPDSEFQRPGDDIEGQFKYDDRWALRDDQSDTEPDFMGDVGAESHDFQRAIEEGEPYFPPTDPVVEPSTGDEAIRVVGGFQDTSMQEMATAEDAEPGQEPDAIDQYRGRDDEDIRDDVLRELSEDALTSDLELSVNVINGVVFLHGTVPGVEDAENAEAVAGRIPGVAEVQDLTETEA
jgi:osmotically-inducible protein OsmY